jgi:hypothetical protein
MVWYGRYSSRDSTGAVVGMASRGKRKRKKEKRHGEKLAVGVLQSC